MRYMTVDELISTWTDNEKEQFKDLIEACKLREQEHLIRLQSIGALDDAMETLKRKSGELKESIIELQEAMIDYMVMFHPGGQLN